MTVVSGGTPARVVGTTLGRRNRPHLLEVWGRRFNVQLEDHMALFRYQDRPGVIGLVGTTFGAQGVNIDAAAVGYEPDEDTGESTGEAVMVVTTHDAIPDALVAEITASGGFAAGRAVSLA